jgi:hypothetical protein
VGKDVAVMIVETDQTIVNINKPFIKPYQEILMLSNKNYRNKIQ